MKDYLGGIGSQGDVRGGLRALSGIVPHYLEYPIIKFVPFEEDTTTPNNTVLNRWLWHFGAFAKYQGIWFPARITQWNVSEQPVMIQPATRHGNNIMQQMREFLKLSTTQINVEELECLYSVFPTGVDLWSYIWVKLTLLDEAQHNLAMAVKRSLDNVLIQAPNRWATRLKAAFNSLRKGEIHIVTGDIVDEVKVIPVPTTIDSIERLQNVYDWKKQEILTMLGITFNPSKRENVTANEILAQTQEMKVQRELLLENVKHQNKKYDIFEEIHHVVDYIQNDLSRIVQDLTGAQIDAKTQMGLLNNSQSTTRITDTNSNVNNNNNEEDLLQNIAGRTWVREHYVVRNGKQVKIEGHWR